jgi:hypothetical protein
LQHLCQTAFSLKTSGIREKLIYIEVRVTPLFKSEFQTIMLEWEDILRSITWIRWEIKGEIKK